jgi:glycosyltransferase involved in cell wall biosynthesis
MRVLFDHPWPFALAHGGFQIQIEQTAKVLRAAGVDVEFVRWWDDAQRGDVIHYFGRPPETYVFMAQQKGMKVVVAELLTELGARPAPLRVVQKGVIKISKRLLPAFFKARMGWESYTQADAVISLTPWEAKMAREIFDVPAARTHVVPNGVEEVFLNSQARSRGPWLVCTATITERKRVLELASAAVAAQTPVWIIGKPYVANDPYFQKFEQLAKAEPKSIRYEGPISDRNRLAEIYREARGFVLLSTMESLSLSALEAAACECPLLLSDLPWARTVFGSDVSYCEIGNTSRTAAALQRFYEQAPTLPVPAKPVSWSEVARQLKNVYERLLSTSR